MTQPPEPPVIIDEFLTFVQNKIDVLDELSIVQICASNFTDIEIETGKSTLVKSLPQGVRNVSRKGEDKNKKNVKDVIKLLKEHDPSLQPIFVARNLNRLPAVSFDSLDVSRFLKDISGMKSELQNIRNDTATKAELMDMQSKLSSELTYMRKSLDKLNCGEIINKTQQKDTIKDTNVIGMTPALKRKQPSTDKRLVPGGRVEMRARRSRSRSSEPTYTPSYRDIVVPTSQRRPIISPITNANKDDDDGFTIVSRKKRIIRTNMCGTATRPSKIKVAELSSAVYISRLNKSTSAEDIKEYIEEMGHKCLDVLLLTQKRETEFNSFKLIVPRSKLDVYLSNEFWPEGIKYRIFRDFVPKRNTRIHKQI